MMMHADDKSMFSGCLSVINKMNADMLLLRQQRKQGRCIGSLAMPDSNLLQQLVVSKAEGLLQQDRQHHTKDEEAFLLRGTVLVTDLN